ncbi:MAG: circularly permuted type 2 ATP-grasp protein [Myxococcota bacterium]|nr:circularly permuted type 2 ATP-grasp protein [Myxococcota bacterium]
MDLGSYDLGGFHDEMFEADGSPRPGCDPFVQRIAQLDDQEIIKRQRAAERAMLTLGITFQVYGHDEGTEKIFPFDVVPRIVTADEWTLVERGLEQRITALNLFVADLYGEQKILRDGIVPRDVIESGKGYLPACRGVTPPRGVWIHVTGTDLVRDASGSFHVLEDNLRCPSGVSYVLENRAVMKRTFPHVFEASKVRAVDEYPGRLRATLEAMAPGDGESERNVVVLTPGIHNSAYFEHSFLAQQMGVSLVQGSDLVVDDDRVYMRTTRGFSRVDVIYRRIDDTFLDPTVFRADSLLGVPGLVGAWAKGNVALCNAPGTGIADDKVVYAYVPQIIRYYLGEDAILPNVPTYLCGEPAQCAYVLEHLDELVVKAANESGGYGMLIGPVSTKEERENFAARIRAEPRNYIAQPTLALSRAPALVNDGGPLRLEGRHVDLRPYILYGEKVYVLPGGLTRVALRPGSLIVNSSQGGGSKDTWVLAE